jgi:SAM-dependent methyltransferase
MRVSKNVHFLKGTRLWRWSAEICQRLRLISYVLRPAIKVDDTRYAYQRLYIYHQFRPGECVLDIGSGGDPFPYATVLADRYLEPTRHRTLEFESHNGPVVICDISALPFPDHHFDYIVCAHVLEHVEDPILACNELQRAGRAGLIETPTLMKDALFAWAKDMHKWHVISICNRLVFNEYSERQLEGIRSSAWQELIFGGSYHPLQKAFQANQDLFNVIFEWNDSFEVVVMKLDGSIEANAVVQPIMGQVSSNA